MSGVARKQYAGVTSVVQSQHTVRRQPEVQGAGAAAGQSIGQD
jgi:hypothetical protein